MVSHASHSKKSVSAPASPTRQPDKSSQFPSVSSSHLLHSPTHLTPDHILYLQRTIGNRAVGQLLRSQNQAAAPNLEADKQAPKELPIAIHQKTPNKTMAQFKLEYEGAADRFGKLFRYNGTETKLTYLFDGTELKEEILGKVCDIDQLAIAEKEDAEALKYRLGLKGEKGLGNQTMHQLDETETNIGSRKQRMVKSYETIVKHKKNKIIKADPLKWTNTHEVLYQLFNQEVNGNKITEGWHTLKALVSLINEGTAAPGTAKTPMTNNEKQDIEQSLNDLEKDEDVKNVIEGLKNNDQVLSKAFRTNNMGELTQIKKNLRDILLQYQDIAANKRYKYDDDGTYASMSVGALNQGEGGNAEILFTRGWLNYSKEEKIATMIHEVSHGTPGLKTLDLAYLESWAAEVISGEAAIINAPNYELAALQQQGKDKTKTLALQRGTIQQQERATQQLGALDHYLTQAWWWLNNINIFGTNWRSNKWHQQNKTTNSGYSKTNFEKGTPYVKDMVDTLNTPAKTSDKNSKSQDVHLFTSADHELIGYYGDILKDLMGLIRKIGKLDADSTNTTELDNDILKMKDSDLAGSDDDVAIAIVGAMLAKVTTPPTETPADFYNNILKAISEKKNVMEGRNQVSGIFKVK